MFSQSEGQQRSRLSISGVRSAHLAPNAPWYARLPGHLQTERANGHLVVLGTLFLCLIELFRNKR